MNATDAGVVTLTLSEPQNPDIVVDPKYTNVIRFSMTLKGPGIEPGDLSVPITIEMPMPNGISPIDLLLLHFYDDGERYDVIVPQILNDGTRISFTLTRFSEFAFVTLAAADGTGTGEDTEDGTADTFGISASPAALEFGSQAFGYEQRPAQTVTITNTGTGTVTLIDLPTVANWTLVPAADWKTPMAAGQTRTFTVRPNIFLFAGSYRSVITITGSDGTSAQINPTFTVTAQPPIESFVIRLYQNVLGRNHDAGGLQYWSSILRSGVSTGATVAYGFFFSAEYLGKNTSNAVYLETLYITLLGRGSDAGGRADWLAQLNSGIPRENVFAGFVISAEYTNICKSYGITRGNYTPPPGGMARVFATRLYRTTLQREPDLSGLNYWHNALKSGSVTGTSAAYGFVFSPEMYSRNLSNAQFVEILYNSMMGRTSDAAGKAYWVGRLNSSASRQDIFYGFANSPEFGKICESHGIRR